MYVALVGPKGKQSVSVREDYIDPVTGKKKARIIETLGPYKRLLEENPRFLEELKEKVKEETRILKEEKNVSVTLETNEVKKSGDGFRFFHIGHIVIKKIWDDMKLDGFFEKHCGKSNAEKFRNDIFYLICRKFYSLNAGRYAAGPGLYAGIEDASPAVCRKTLGKLGKLQDALTEYLNAFFKKSTRREFGRAFYETHDYCFGGAESEEPGSSCSLHEEKKKEVPAVMGLLTDVNGIPISFQLFSGNATDPDILKETVFGLKKKYGIGGIIGAAGEDICKDKKEDGYGAAAADGTDLPAASVSGAFKSQRTIEGSFEIFRADPYTAPGFVWEDEYVTGHFTLCYTCLCIIRYIQYLYFEKTGKRISFARITDALDSAKAIVMGEKGRPYIGVSLSDDYIETAHMLGLPYLQKIMSPVRFRHLGKIDMAVSLAKPADKN